MIKVVIIFFSGLSFVLFSCTSQQQKTAPVDCSLLRTGKFELKSSYDNELYSIERKDSIQREINLKTGMGAILRIEWKDSCEYELTNLGYIINGRDSLVDDPYPFPMKTRIIKVTPNYLICRSVLQGDVHIDTMLIQKYN